MKRQTPEVTVKKVCIILNILIIFQFIYLFTTLIIILSGNFLNVNATTTILITMIIGILMLLSRHYTKKSEMIGANLSIITAVAYTIISFRDLSMSFEYMNQNITYAMFMLPVIVQLIVGFMLLVYSIKLKMIFQKGYYHINNVDDYYFDKTAKPIDLSNVDLPDSVDGIKRTLSLKKEFEEYNGNHSNNNDKQ